MPDATSDVWTPWMRRALQLAGLAEGRTSPNPMVGALVLDHAGKLVGEGFHAKSGDPHAEVKALSQAGSKAVGGTLVVSLEPCCHQGRTPPCTEAILASGIAKVVIALQDPDPRVRGEGITRLRDAGLEVVLGVLEKEAAYQNRAFIFRVCHGRPWGILKWAMSLDGRIALPNGASKWISSSGAREWVHQLRAQCDAVIVGGGTVRSDNPLLTSRGISDPEPLRVVLTKSLDLPDDARLWDTSLANTLVAHGWDVDQSKFPAGPDRLVLDSVSPLALSQALSKKNCNCVLWECGPALATAAIKQKCIQEISVVVAPKLLGGVSAQTPLSNLGFSSIEDVLMLQNESFQKLGPDWVFNMISSLD